MKTMKAIAGLCLTLAIIPQAYALNPEKVLAAIKANSKITGLEIKDGKLALTQSEYNRKERGFEDCRQIALNHTLLDVGVEGKELLQFNNDSSFRIKLISADDEQQRSIVGVDVKTAGGAATKVRYTYDMQDGTDKYCDLIKSYGSQPGITTRAEVEQSIMTTVIPLLSPDDLAKRSPRGTNLTAAADIVKANVKKLIKTECTASAVNEAVKVSYEHYRKKNGNDKTPLLLIDMDNSSLLGDSIGLDQFTGVDTVTATISTVMTDSEGENVLKVITEMVLMQTNNESCRMKYNSHSRLAP